MMNNIHTEKEISDDLYNQLKIMETEEDSKLREFQITENSGEEEDEFDDEEEEEFSFASVGEDAAAISADHAFSDGQIKAVFPLFDQSLLLSGDGDLPENFPMRPPVNKVFVETSSSADDQIAGPYCEWSSRKAVEAAPESCKKSNSTGFSKIWRLKEITCRSNSDGRDAFVFLNGNHAPPSTAAAEKAAPPPETVKKSGKEKKKTVSPHEAYLRSKAKDEERQRRSYLPYRPELMGFFTNVNGGLTRNVHPF
ncbi:hypothetical protein SASPL_140264 [Salvia splendens]|uniref:Uncharacterized protein n=1 Tax=Salvia splendens TaxID=180675 RepID=A0A8X8WQG9_SALSN|nr:uncharacterized protein LOC121766663 [Salvia splendens]KAG6398794.1 hypothetical protein SASPL_140264 [Salvia splendens]